MPRSQLADYAGANGRIDIARGLDLAPDRYGFMPKIDGAYSEIHTDQDGRIRMVLARNGNDLAEQLPEFIGMRIGLPGAVLQAEAELWTEAARRNRKARGYTALHLFDVSRYKNEYVARQPFASRRSLLSRWQDEAQSMRSVREVPFGDRWRARRSGKIIRPAYENLKFLPLVPLVLGAGGAADLWRNHVEYGGGEGLVAVRLDAPMGKRSSKLKLKKTHTIDCVVIDRDRSCATLLWAGNVFAVACSGRKNEAIKAGDVVEVLCEGVYEEADSTTAGRRRRDSVAARMTPRFPRIVRVRPDLH